MGRFTKETTLSTKTGSATMINLMVGTILLIVMHSRQKEQNKTKQTRLASRPKNK